RDSSAAEDRLSGYLDEMRRRFALFDEQLIAPGDYSIEAGRRACAQFLALDRRPTAIVSASDFMAIGAMAALREHGLVVPRDMSVTGFDDIYVSALPWIDLTTLHPHSRELGARTAEVLLARIDKTANGGRRRAGADPNPARHDGAAEAIGVSDRPCCRHRSTASRQ
ncbi:MAG: substrate-binding domain-containing protein, partial [Dongiaceae bacterium]